VGWAFRWLAYCSARWAAPAALPAINRPSNDSAIEDETDEERKGDRGQRGGPPARFVHRRHCCVGRRPDASPVQRLSDPALRGRCGGSAVWRDRRCASRLDLPPGLRPQRRHDWRHLRCAGVCPALHGPQLHTLSQRQRPDSSRAGSPTHPRSNRADGAVQRGRRRGVLPRPRYQLPVWLFALLAAVRLVTWPNWRCVGKKAKF
jgi:hypothetical protein